MAGLETPPNSDDPIASLYKMSTTAGMGAGDYVEVNKTAVAAASLAVVSLLAFLGWPFLLLGLVAVLCGMAALRQIRNSNGTQGGRLVAWFGILGAVAVAGGLVTVEMVRQADDAANGRQINALLDQFSKAMAAGDYEKARSLFVPEFQQKVSLEKFKAAWGTAAEMERLGRFVSLRSNDRYGFTEGKGGSVYFGFTMGVSKFEKFSGDVGVIFAARDERGQWQLYNVPRIFGDKLLPAPR